MLVAYPRQRTIQLFYQYYHENETDSKAFVRAMEGFTTRHKMTRSVSLPTVTYLYEGASTFSSWSGIVLFLLYKPIYAPPSGPGLICTAGEVFIWDDTPVTPLNLVNWGDAERPKLSQLWNDSNIIETTIFYR